MSVPAGEDFPGLSVAPSANLGGPPVVAQVSPTEAPRQISSSPAGSVTPGVNTALTERTGGPGPLPGGSTTPGVNTGLTAEQQRALMFQGGA